MNILVLGNGAREHALCFSIAKSDQLSKLFCAPGNYGISKIAEVHNFDINNFDTLYDFCLANKIDLYGFSSSQINDKNYVEIIDLLNKGLLIKNLIKPEYLS